MIISRTPLRISLCGGGTDVPAFYHKYGGAVVSFAINKYVYVSINDKFDGRIRVSYSQTEDVAHVDDIQHDIVRETLKLHELNGVEVTTVADIPGNGSGLGSSSSLTVGLVAAIMQKIKGAPFGPLHLAESAYTIEARLCNHVGTGKQDQFAAAFGGLHYYEFKKDECVSVEPILLSLEQQEYLESHLLLLWTGVQRSSSELLQLQSANFKNNHDTVISGMKLRNMANNLAMDFQEGNINVLGKYMHENWKLKRRLASGISNAELDRIYHDAVGAGAIGGKVLGAGGGGFFLFFAPPLQHNAILEATGLRRVSFKIEEEGSKIIYDDEHQ